MKNIPQSFGVNEELQHRAIGDRFATEGTMQKLLFSFQ